MSNAGQAALTIVGTVVGAYFGYPQLGYAIGSLAGSYLFPTQLPTLQGPRLADLGQTQANVGAPIPRVWGRAPLPGNIIYQSDLREVVTSEDVGGKGGPTQEVEQVSYYQDFFIGLSDRPASRASAIAGVRRIQANGKWIYDTRPQQPGESADSFSKRIAGNEALEEKMTIYLGTADQMPDPTMEAHLGVGNVSGYRDRAGLMFTNWLLRQEDGTRIPGAWLVEVFTEGDLTLNDGTEYSNEVLFEWIDGDNPLNARNVHEFYVQGAGTYGTVPGVFDSIDAVVHAGAAQMNHSAGEMIYLGQSRLGGLGSQPLPTTRFPDSGGSLHVSDDARGVLHYNRQGPTRYKSAAEISAAAGVGTCAHYQWLFLDSGDITPVHTDDFGFFASDSWFQVVQTAPGVSPGVVPEGWDTVHDDCFEGGHPYNYVGSWDLEIHVRRQTRAPDDPCAPMGAPPPPRVPGTEGFCIVSGRIRSAGPWELVTGPGDAFKVLQYYVEANPVVYPLNPARPTGHADDNETFWTDAYELAVASGDMPAGLTYGVHYPQNQSFAYKRDSQYRTAETLPVSIATILRDNFLESGLAEEDFDVSDLEEVFVTGFVRTRPMTARAVAESLRPVGFFDVIESEGKIKCVTRGKPIAATLTEKDLGTYENGSTQSTRISSTKQLEMEVPRVVRVHFFSDDRDLEIDEASSPVAVDTDTVHELDMEIVVVMDSARARQIAEVAWADLRMSVNRHEISLDHSFSRIEPADTLAVPLNSRLERMRVADIDDRASWVRRLQLIRDDDGTTLGAAIGTAAPNIPPVSTIVSPAELLLLDLPALRDDDDDAGVYAAARPYLADVTFRGAQILRSTDGGGNYTRIAGISSATAIGRLVQALPAGPAGIWDDGNELIVEVQNGVLENRTAADVLAGANAAAVGADGRWEIVQFRDHELLSGNIYRLTGLLRGRRGTERFIGTSATDDRLVMISTGQIARVPLNLQMVGRESLYKCVAAGTTIDNAEEIAFTGWGVALKPLSPVDIAGERDAEGNLAMTWIRRSRFGEGWLDGTDVPLSEEREDYEIDVLSGSTVLRTISTSTPGATYTAEQQLTDFGSLQAVVPIEVFQISTAVGRGTGREAIL